MQISKILNNNVVITEKDQAEVVVMGRGLAFGKKIGDKITVDKIEKCYTLQGDESSRIGELLAEIPDEIFVITDKVITVQLDGKYFEALVKQGDVVKKGQRLLTFDIDAIEAAGYSTQTPVIVMNTPSYEQINVTDKQTVSGQDMLLVRV